MPPRPRPFTSFLTQGMNNTNQNINNLSQSPQFNNPIQPGFGNTNYLSPPGGGIMTPTPFPGNEQPEGAQQGGQLFDDPSGNTGGMDNYPDWYDTSGHYDDLYNLWLNSPDGLEWSQTAPGSGGGADLNNDGVADDLDSQIWQNLTEMWASGTDYGSGMGYPGSDATAPPFDQYDPQFKGELGYKPSPISSIKDKPQQGFDFTEMGPPRRKVPPTDSKGKFWPELGYPKPPTSADFTELTKGPLIPGDVAEYNPGLGTGEYDIPTGPDDPEQPPMPTEELPAGFNWQWVNGEWQPVEASIFAGGQKEKPIFTPTPGGTGTELNIPNYLQEQQQDAPFTGSLGSMYSNKPYMTNTYGPGWEWVYDESQGAGATGWSQQFQSDPTELDLGGLQMPPIDTSFGGMTENISENLAEYEYQQWLGDNIPAGVGYEQGFDVNQDGYVTQEDYDMLENISTSGFFESDIGGVDQYEAFDNYMNSLVPEGENPTDWFMSLSEQDMSNLIEQFQSGQHSALLENLGAYLNPYSSQAASQFAGGGGQGGAAARKLYYPGTSGGFAGVGSGIKGGGGMKSFMESLMG
jgi:hypothetical protein